MNFKNLCTIFAYNKVINNYFSKDAAKASVFSVQLFEPTTKTKITQQSGVTIRCHTNYLWKSRKYFLSTTKGGAHRRPKTCRPDSRRRITPPVFHLDTAFVLQFTFGDFLAATVTFTSALIVVTHKTKQMTTPHTNYTLQTC